LGGKLLYAGANDLSDIHDSNSEQPYTARIASLTVDM
jgi:hypothetical protein